MTRLYHSASSVELYRRCPRAWYYRYVAGLKEPEVTWADIEAGAEYTSRQRSTALGKAVHAVLESHYREQTPDWTSEPGQIAQTGMTILPDAFSGVLLPEAAIGKHLMPKGAPEHAPKWRYRSPQGIWWAGFIDLLCEPAPKERRRLRLDPDALVVIDYKTSSSIGRWAKSIEDLQGDLQANLYTSAVCDKYDRAGVQLLWAYMQTRGARLAAPRVLMRKRTEAREVLARAEEVAAQADLVQTIDDASPNTASCGDYGGCPYHATAGGPCKARRRIGAIIQARKKKPMTEEQDKEEFKKKLAEIKAKKEAVAEPDEGEGKPRRKKVAKKTAKKETEAGASAKPKRTSKSKTAQVGALAVELDELIAARDDAREALANATKELETLDAKVAKTAASIRAALPGETD